MLKKRWWGKMLPRRMALLLLLMLSAVFLAGCLYVFNYVGCRVTFHFPTSINCGTVSIPNAGTAQCIFPGPGRYSWTADRSSCCGSGSGTVDVPGWVIFTCEQNQLRMESGISQDAEDHPALLTIGF
jgi:hypothetical protein